MNNNWEEREQIFHEALALHGEQRNSFLLKACSENKKQLSEIEALLKAFESDADFLEEPVFDIALGLFGKKNSRILTGSTLGFYQVGTKIGEGGMGEVYDALDTKLNRRVALKFISESFDDDNEARHQLIREAQAVALLEHDNICGIYGIEQIETHHFIVMQYIEGLTLAELIEKYPLRYEQVLSITRQLLSAVHFAHSHGIIHRDLKPANIMMRSDEQIKVLDFGLAKTIQSPANSGQEKQNTSFSRNGLIIGTVGYMSPEQLRGEKLNFQSDIFSIGIIMYELISGKNPFARDSQAETIAAILNEEVKPLEGLKAKHQKNLPGIVRKCLQKDKIRRFSSTAEILIELENARPKRSVAKILKAALVISLVLLAFAAMFLLAGKPKPSLAILPIVNKSGDENKQFLADGLTHELIENLSNVSGLNIKKEPDLRVFSKNPDQLDPQKVGQELRVDAVLAGSLYLRDGYFFIETRIIRTSDGAVLDPADFSLNDFDIVSIRENISQRIADKLQFELTEKERNRLAQITTQDPEVLRWYFLGRYHLNRRNPEDLKKAIQCFTLAFNREPGFAKAWTGLADVYLELSVPGRSGTMSPEDAVNMAKGALSNALKLDPELIDSIELINSQGNLEQKFYWNWPRAEQNFRDAISLDSDFAPAHLELSKVLMTTGRLDGALAEAIKAKDLDPLNISSQLNLGRIYYFRRDYEKAEQLYLDVFENSPDKTRALFLLGYLYMKTGKIKEATENFEKVYSENPQLGAAGLGYCYGKTGQKYKAQEVLEKLDQLSKEGYVSSQEKAIIYLGLGDTDKVFQFLDAACKEKFAAFPGLLSDPLLDEIRLDPRFSDLKQCAHL